MGKPKGQRKKKNKATPTRVEPVKPVFYRVATFHATESQQEVAPLEWVREPEYSTLPVADMINKFIVDKNCKPVFVSSPNITLLSQSETPKRRMFSISVSMVYEPQEKVRVELVKPLGPAPPLSSS